MPASKFSLSAAYNLLLNASAVHALPQAQSMVFSALYKSLVLSGFSIKCSVPTIALITRNLVMSSHLQNLTGSLSIISAPLPYIGTNPFVSGLAGIMSALFLGFSFAATAGGAVIAAVKEKESRAKHQQV